MSSPYYTNEPEEACLFILSIDTLDRDSLSHDFVRNLGSRLSNLEVRQKLELLVDVKLRILTNNSDVSALEQWRESLDMELVCWYMARL